MRPHTSADRGGRIILIVIALFLPTLSLIPLGGAFLWEHGFLVYWTVAALVWAAGTTLLQRWLLRPTPRLVPGPSGADRQSDPGLPLDFSPGELRAWGDVEQIAARVDTDQLASLEALLKLGQQTVDAVARRLHPEKKDALWQFTVPEALAIMERVSARLGLMIETKVPFGNQLTVAQVLTAYRWRNMIGVAERTYDAWRLIRLTNPALALTNEARERMSRAVLSWSRDHVARRLAETYVEEVGRAAIDLYGGRLRAGVPGEGAGPGQPVAPAQASARAVVDARPISVTLLGTAADITALFDGFTRSATARMQTSQDFPMLAPQVTRAVLDRSVARRQLLRCVSDAEILVWVVQSNTGMTLGDRSALRLIEARATADPHLPHVPIIVAVVARPSAAADDAATCAAALRESPPGGAVDVDQPGRWRVVVVPFDGPDLDMAPVLDAISDLKPQVMRLRAIRRLNAARGRGSLTANVGQAASAATSLVASLLIKRRGNGRP